MTNQAWREGGPRFRLGHRPALDGVRGAAILLVIASHSPLQRYLPGGGLGVQVFFVLSGFLITALLLAEHDRAGAVRLGAFYRRRALRLLPALGVFLLASAPFNWLVYGRPAVGPGLWDGLAVLLYYYNWSVVGADGIRTWVFGHTWSLAVEEQFYLVWPAALAVFLGLPRGRRWVVVAALAGAAVPAVVRAALWLNAPAGRSPFNRVYYGTDTRADALFAGALLALAVSRYGLPAGAWGRRTLGAAGWAGALVLAACCLRHSPAGWYYFAAHFTVLGAAAVALIAALLADAPGLARAFGWPPLVALGRLSYGVYLWHIPVNILVFGDPGAYDPRFFPTLGISVGAFALALGLAHLSYEYVERPFLRLKDRVAPAQVWLRVSDDDPPARRAA